MIVGSSEKLFISVILAGFATVESLELKKWSKIDDFFAFKMVEKFQQK